MHALNQSRIVHQVIKQILSFFTTSKISTGIFFMVAQIYAANSYALTFDWETGADDGATVSQTVSGYVATVSTSNADAYLDDLSGIGGSTGNVVTSEAITISSMTVTFSTPINLDTAYVFDTIAPGGNWVFTPTGGSNAVVNQAVGTAGVTVNLNWTDVTEFTVTNSTGAADGFGLDDLNFTPPPPPHVQSIAVSGTPAANASSMAYTVTFNENANGVSTDDFSLTTVTGNAAGQIASVSSATGSSIDVTVDNISGAGDLRLDLNTNTDIIDDVGNGNGTNGFVAAFTTGAVHVVDRIPTITTAVYDADAGTLVVTGTNFEAKFGAANDVDVSLLTFTGEAGAQYTLTDAVDVEIDSATQFTVVLSGTEKNSVDSLLNKNGSSSNDVTIYNLAAADDFIAELTVGDTSDVTANGITVTFNIPGDVTVAGGTIVGQTLMANVTDANGISGAVTYQWKSAGSNVGSNADSYILLASDEGNTITVDASYIDDITVSENLTSTATSAVISILTDALNTISATANNGVSPLPSVNDYSNAGVNGVIAQVLPLVNIAVANAASSADVDSAVEIQVLVDVILNGQDADGDGIPDFLEGATSSLDTDGDGVFDFIDQDSDNDGISDALEAGIDLTDTDNDGIADALDSDIGNDNNGTDPGKTDANFDGVDDSFSSILDVAADQDNDGIPNHYDLDSDNDSLLDIVETGGLDVNADGLLDATGVLATVPLRNDDADALPNYLDITSGTNFDITLAGLAQFDVNTDGVIDNTVDMDNDGIIDVVDNAVGAFGSLIDFDGDGIPNHIDDDDDNDGILDTEENPRQSDFTGLDADADGIDDGVDADVNGVLTGADADGNGVQDDKEFPDLDGDGLADYLDNDSDNDGIHDSIDPLVSLEKKKKSGGGFTSPLMLMILLSLIGLRQKKLAVA